MKKPIAEECFILRRVEIDRVLRDREFSGIVTLKTKALTGRSLVVKWMYCLAAREPAIRLDYQWQGESLGHVVKLAGQHCFDGKRLALKFVCSACEQTSYKIFLPALIGAKTFLCRSCWHIDYLTHVRPRKASVFALNRVNDRLHRVEQVLDRLKEQYERLRISLIR